jgi:integrase
MSLYKQKGSDVWSVNIRHAGHRVRRSTGETDRAAAQLVHNQIQVELWQAVPITDEHTWGDACDLWLDAETRSASELLSLAKFTKGFPDRALSDVTAESIEKALAFCGTAGTFMRYRAMLMAILNGAKKKGWIAALPPVATRRDKKKKTRDWLTPEQFEKLYAELPKHMKPMAKFAVETGLRQANVLGLEWSRVDLERRVCWIEAEEMKADQALTVPLGDGAVTVLEAQKAIKGEKDTHVFLYRGHPISEVKTSFQAACVRAGLGKWVDDKYQGFTWHGLRHTWATWHAQNGTPMEVLQKLGGWADARMVANYSHHSPTYLAGFANNNRKAA